MLSLSMVRFKLGSYIIVNGNVFYFFPTHLTVKLITVKQL